MTNTPLESESTADGWVTHVFAESQPMSSYLVAITAGRLDSIPIEGMSIPGRIYTVAGQSHLAQLAAEMTPPILEALERFATERGHTMVELAFAWLLAHPEVSSVIAGATRIEQLVQNAAASDWELTSEEMADLDKLLPNSPGPGTGNLPRRRSAVMRT